MVTASAGDVVQVHYTGRLEDGTVFDSSTGRQPLQVTLGAHEVIRGFEEALLGMEPGESKTVTIPADEAYGPWREELSHKVDRGMLPPTVEPEAGQRLQATNRMGQTMALTVVEVDEDTVTLDGNHPLAGEDLTFDLELVSVDRAA